MASHIPWSVKCSSGICKALGPIPGMNSMMYAYNTSRWKLEDQMFKVILDAT